MNRHVLVPLLKSVVFPDVVQVVTANDYGPLHLQLQDDTREDAATNVDVTGEWAFLVNVVPVDGLQKIKTNNEYSMIKVNCAIKLMVIG